MPARLTIESNAAKHPHRYYNDPDRLERMVGDLLEDMREVSSIRDLQGIHTKLTYLIGVLNTEQTAVTNALAYAALNPAGTVAKPK